MTGEPQKLCRRCLLRDLSESTDVAAYVQKTFELTPLKEQAGAEEYERRLDLCRECDSLNAAVCQKCGCYVEIRAIRKDVHCPAARRKW